MGMWVVKLEAKTGATIIRSVWSVDRGELRTQRLHDFVTPGEPVFEWASGDCPAIGLI